MKKLKKTEKATYKPFIAWDPSWAFWLGVLGWLWLRSLNLDEVHKLLLCLKAPFVRRDLVENCSWWLDLCTVCLIAPYRCTPWWVCELLRLGWWDCALCFVYVLGRAPLAILSPFVLAVWELFSVWDNWGLVLSPWPEWFMWLFWWFGAKVEPPLVIKILWFWWSDWWWWFMGELSLLELDEEEEVNNGSVGDMWATVFCKARKFSVSHSLTAYKRCCINRISHILTNM